MNILDRLLVNLDIEKMIVENKKKNDAKTLKFLDNAEVDMTVLSSIVLLFLFFIVTALVLISKEHSVHYNYDNIRFCF